MKRRKLGTLLLLATALFAVDLTFGIGSTDDAWTLQVFHRVGSGDHLYGQVWFGVTPLSAWIGAAATALLGTQLVVLKGLVALCSAATALLAGRIAGRLGVGRTGQVLVIVASVAYLDFPSPNLYSPLAYLLLLVSMSATLEWRRRATQAPHGGARKVLLAAGAAAGLCIASKQNIGLLTLAAVLGGVTVAAPRRAIGWSDRAVEIGLVAGAAIIAAALPLIPVAVDGDLGKLIAYGFEKGKYVHHGSLSYLDGLRSLVNLVGRPFSEPRTLAAYVAFLIPPASILALATAARRGERRLALTVAVFLGAAIAGVFPRADFNHVNDAIPLCAIALAWSMKRLSEELTEAARRRGLAMIAAVVTLPALSLVAHPVAQALRGDSTISHIRSFAGVVVPAELPAEASEFAATLREADGGADSTFILLPNAAFGYLLSGLSNPTPFDYPTPTDFGPSMEADVIAAIREGRIRQVCMGSFARFWSPRPGRLVRYVRKTMVPRAQIRTPQGVDPSGACTIYRVG
jgi:hypothetical protein